MYFFLKKRKRKLKFSMLSKLWLSFLFKKIFFHKDMSILSTQSIYKDSLDAFRNLLNKMRNVKS